MHTYSISSSGHLLIPANLQAGNLKTFRVVTFVEILHFSTSLCVYFWVLKPAAERLSDGNTYKRCGVVRYYLVFVYDIWLK